MGGRHVVKGGSDPRVAYPEVKVQVRDLVRVVDIFAPFAPLGFSIRGNSFYRAPVGRWAQETCAGCPQQRYITGEPDKVQGRDRVVLQRGPVGTGPGRSGIRGKFVLSRNPGYRTMGVAMWLNHLLSPR